MNKAVALRQGQADESVAEQRFQETEAGLIPCDWHLVKAGSIGKFRGGNGFPLVQQGRAAGNYPFFKVSDMNNEGNKTFMCVANNYISEATRQHLGAALFPEKTIVFAKVGAAVFLERKRILKQASCLDNNMAGFEIDEKLADPRFIHYWLLNFRLGNLVSTTALPSLSGGVLQGIPIALPPTTAEQEAVAEALADADALIESLEKLIAKKRAIKHGAMQELLTGKRRLPGFDSPWAIRAIGDDVETLDAGVSVNSVETDISPAAGPAILKTSCVSRGAFNPRECKTIVERDLGRARLSPLRDTVIISRMNTPDLVGECGYVGGNYIDLFLPDRLWMTGFRKNAELTARWLALTLSSDRFRSLLKSIATGTSGSMKNIAKEAFLSLKLVVPSGEEQAAIACVLSDMDSELEALETKLAEVRQIKQGMMQELLTGRIRLL